MEYGFICNHSKHRCLGQLGELSRLWNGTLFTNHREATHFIEPIYKIVNFKSQYSRDAKGLCAFEEGTNFTYTN